VDHRGSRTHQAVAETFAGCRRFASVVNSLEYALFLNTFRKALFAFGLCAMSNTMIAGIPEFQQA